MCCKTYIMNVIFIHYKRSITKFITSLHILKSSVRCEIRYDEHSMRYSDLFCGTLHLNRTNQNVIA